MRISPRSGGVIVAVVLAVGVWAVPAEAVVHEIVAAWCSGQELEPPGLSRPGSQNFAQPVNSNGFVGDVVFDPDLGGLLVTFNYDHPASKVQGSGVFIQIGSTPTDPPVPIFIELVEPDPDFPAFQHCPRLAEFGI
jgi:hypothetical protein